jgi:hypothetical protein
MKYGAKKPNKPAPAVIAPVVPKPIETPPVAAKLPVGILGLTPYVEPDGLWSPGNKEWLALADRTALVKGNPHVGGELVAVYSHRDNIMEVGELRKGQKGYVPALTFNRLHNFFNALDQKDADKKVAQAEKEYAEL